MPASSPTPLMSLDPMPYLVHLLDGPLRCMLELFSSPVSWMGVGPTLQPCLQPVPGSISPLTPDWRP